MRKEKEQIRKKIVAFWKGCDQGKKESFYAFMKKNELSPSTLYNHMKCECVGVPLIKMRGILSCIEEFEENQL